MALSGHAEQSPRVLIDSLTWYYCFKIVYTIPAVIIDQVLPRSILIITNTDDETRELLNGCINGCAGERNYEERRYKKYCDNCPC